MKYIMGLEIKVATDVRTNNILHNDQYLRSRWTYTSDYLSLFITIVSANAITSCFSLRIKLHLILN